MGKSINCSLLWSQVCEALHQVISPDAVARWFRPVVVAGIHDTELILSVDNDIYKYWIEDNYLPQLNSVASRLLERPIVCKIVLALSATAAATPTLLDGMMPALLEKAPVATPQVTESTTGLHPRYTMETFIVGSNNELAAAAARAVMDAPARTYNPLFIHGQVGLGKTHLMQAIGNALLKRKKNFRVLYVTSEQFTNEFISSIQHGELVKFRKRYRQVDALLIDDIQFLAGKDKSQEEFFHTFNSLFDGSKQIVLTSDSPPSEIASIEKRLISRFEWGLNAPVLPPGVETRLAILRHKLEFMQITLPDQVLEFIAQRVKTNVRRLEGALNRVAVYAALQGRDLSLVQIESLLKDLLQHESSNSVTMDLIQRKVAEHFDIRLADMTSKRRPASIAIPRMVAMYLSRRMTTCSLNDIGDAFGGRDHGTVLHAQKKVVILMEQDTKLRQSIDILVDKLTSSV
jgi:chromosomal replication initiator protein